MHLLQKEAHVSNMKRRGECAGLVRLLFLTHRLLPCVASAPFCGQILAQLVEPANTLVLQTLEAFHCFLLIIGILKRGRERERLREGRREGEREGGRGEDRCYVYMHVSVVFVSVCVYVYERGDAPCTCANSLPLSVHCPTEVQV